MRARDAAVGLLAVAALGVGVRLAPLASFAVWGSDTGEYHRLVAQLLADGRLPLDYQGWGVAYPWFPGAYTVAGGVAAMTGLDPRACLEVLVPALAGLAPVGVALLAWRLWRDARAALLAGGAAAVFLPIAFATSHAMPGALGHLLLVAAVLLLWDAERDARLWPGLALCLLALVATHHLTTYMLLLGLGGIALLRALLRTRPDPAGQRAVLTALGLLLALAVGWWWWAIPIREQIAPSASAFGLAGLAVVAACGLALLWRLPAWRARWGWRFRPRWPAAAQGLRRVGGMVVVVLVGSAVVGFVQVPGTSVRLTPLAVLWFVPLVVLVAWGFLGSQRAKFLPQGADVYGWALALLASFLGMMAIGSTVLLPYRHPEYILEPAAILAGGGLAAALALAAQRGPRAGRLAAAGAVALLLANGALAYPPPSVLAGFQEGTTRGEFAGVLWARDHVALAQDGLVAADHRLSSLLFGFAGLNATWEYAPLTFQAPTFDAARAEMQAVRSPSGTKRVDVVFLTEGEREGLALLQWEPAQPLSPAAQAKFDSDPHYVPLCRSPEVVVYRVDWSLALPRPASMGPCAP